MNVKVSYVSKLKGMEWVQNPFIQKMREVSIEIVIRENNVVFKGFKK